MAATPMDSATPEPTPLEGGDSDDSRSESFLDSDSDSEDSIVVDLRDQIFKTMFHDEPELEAEQHLELELEP